MRYDPRIGHYHSPEELHPSPNPAELAKMLNYGSVEEMEKACAMEAQEEDHPDIGEDEDYTKWCNDHPFACQFCSDFNKGYPPSFYDPGESEGCEGSHWQSMYLPGFPFENGCKYHSKRRESK